jgi:hypothetical protein
MDTDDGAPLAAVLDSAAAAAAAEAPANANDFPSVYLCPYLYNEPPVNGVYFDVRGRDGRLSTQIFEYSRLYRDIATMSTGRAYNRSVRHPLNAGWILRSKALAAIRRVSPEVQAVLNEERTRQSLDLVDDVPLVDADTELYNQTMTRVANE